MDVYFLKVNAHILSWHQIDGQIASRPLHKLTTGVTEYVRGTFAVTARL